MILYTNAEKKRIPEESSIIKKNEPKINYTIPITLIFLSYGDGIKVTPYYFLLW
jgi:hypothetical protein